MTADASVGHCCLASSVCCVLILDLDELRKNINKNNFCLFITDCIVKPGKKSAKILRKIKTTLHRRKSKSKQTPTATGARSEDTALPNTTVSTMESTFNRSINSNRHQLSGQLCKYTNVMKGWQYRWFTVDAQAGTLSYYLCDSSSSGVGDDTSPSALVLANTPRGQVHLAAAVVCPSDEDSRTFSIGCASGDTVKLRAVDARARQEWVDGLRAVVESHTKALDINNSSPLPPRELLAASDALVVARQELHQAEQCNASLARTIENIEGTTFSPTDPDLLVLKAISNANTQCLHQCLSLLQRHQEIHNTSSTSSNSNQRQESAATATTTGAY